MAKQKLAAAKLTAPNKTEPEQQLQRSTNPASLLQQAIERGLDIAHLEKLMDLQDRWEKKESQKEFFHALAQFQRQCPVIRKNKKTSFNTKTGGNMSYAYATLDEIIEQIKEPLAAACLTYRFQTEETGEAIKVSCIITHAAGHSEINSMSGKADTSGLKNEIQSRGSTVTYLQRYTLIGSLGIGTADQDVDGAGTKPNETARKPTDVSEEIKKEIAGIDNIVDLERHWNEHKSIQKFAPYFELIKLRKSQLQ